MRYIGHKPFNWPAAVLIFGWMVAGLILFAGGDRVISLFDQGLVSTPLYWQPAMSELGFIGIVAPVVLGGVALWIMPRVDWSPKWSTWLIALGFALFLAGLAWDIRAGVAIYPDRVILRSAGWTSSNRIEYFRDINRLETACIVRHGRRGTRTPTIDYHVWFQSGKELVLSWRWGLFSNAADDQRKLLAITAVNDGVNRAEATRAPRRDRDGQTMGSRSCVSLLASRYGARIEDVSDLFSVHRSELRPDEYRIVPAPEGS